MSNINVDVPGKSSVSFAQSLTVSMLPPQVAINAYGHWLESVKKTPIEDTTFDCIETDSVYLKDLQLSLHKDSSLLVYAVESLLLTAARNSRDVTAIVDTSDSNGNAINVLQSKSGKFGRSRWNSEKNIDSSMVICDYTMSLAGTHQCGSLTTQYVDSKFRGFYHLQGSELRLDSIQELKAN